ncbi:MAG: NAD-dependent epimerase/dehydratase family protein [Candidatus Thorarchaeota archaeon]
MKILITGAFGNIGKAVIEEAYKKGHEVTVFEIENRKTRKIAFKYRKKIKKVFYSDIRNLENVKQAVQDIDAVIHLAAIIPPLSQTNRDLTMAVNLGGTKNLITAIKETKRSIPLIFSSSASVMGSTQSQDKLVSRNDPLVITQNYEESKIKCEELLNDTADNYLVFRLAGVLPLYTPLTLGYLFGYMEEVFDMHFDSRMEMILDVDIATALVTGIEKLHNSTTPKNQAYILGGGKENSLQFKGLEFLTKLFGSFSLPVPDKKYFTTDIEAFHLDWHDTIEAQKEFHFQNHTLDEYIQYITKRFRAFKLPIKLFKKIIIKWLVKKSPYYQ